MQNYFSHDSNARNSDKLLNVRMKYGAEGYGIYFMLLERLRDEAEYMSVKDYNMLAFDLRVDAGKVKNIIEDFGLFTSTEDGRCFYSEGLNERMNIKDAMSKKRAEAGKQGAKNRWKSDGDSKTIANEWQTDGNAIANEWQNIASKEKESKEKESKVNNNISAKAEASDDADSQSKLTKKQQQEADFEALWKLYPRKSRKNDAYKAYLKALKEGATNEEIQNGILAYKKQIQVQKTDMQFVAQGGTWFNQQRWKDEYDTGTAQSPANDYDDWNEFSAGGGLHEDDLPF